MNMYYIKDNGKIYGPANENKIRTRLNNYTFSKNCEISIDKQNWFLASEKIQIEPLPYADPVENNSALHEPENIILPPPSEKTKKKLKGIFNPIEPAPKNNNFVKTFIAIAAIIVLMLICSIPFILIAKKNNALSLSSGCNSFADVADKYGQAVGVVVVTLDDPQGTKVDWPSGTAWAISKNKFVTNAHVIYGLKMVRESYIEYSIRCRAKEAGVKNEEEYEEWCKRNKSWIDSLYTDIKVRDITIRLSHSNGKVLTIDSVQTHRKYEPQGDGTYDIAILTTNETTDTYFSIASKKELHSLKTGIEVASLGFPMGNLHNYGGLNVDNPEATLKSGTISKITNQMDSHSDDPAQNRKIVHSIPGTNGVSGSPIFLKNGKVVAIFWGGENDDPQALHHYATRIDILDEVNFSRKIPIDKWLEKLPKIVMQETIKKEKRIASTENIPTECQSFTDVQSKYGSAVGVVVLSYRDSNGKRENVPMGTAWALSPHEFATNAHVAYALTKNDMIKSEVGDYLRKLAIEEGVIIKTETDWQKYCQKKLPMINEMITNIKERKLIEVTIRLSHSNGKIMIVKNIKPHRKYVPGGDGTYDIAILTTNETTNAYFPIASKEELYKLQGGIEIASLGFPMEGITDNGGLNTDNPEATFASGVIKKITAQNDAHSNDPSQNLKIVHSLESAGGASGSPIFLKNGKVVAILWGGTNHGKDSAGNRISSAAMYNFATRIDVLDEAKTVTPILIKDWFENY